MLNALNSNSKFLVLGRAGMDLYADPAGAQVETAARFVSALGGSAGNIAAGLATHGIATSLLTCVSDDAVGRFVTSQLKHYGIDTRHVAVLKDESRTSLAVTETRIENTQNTLYRNNASDLQLSAEHVENVPFDGFDALILTGTALAVAPSRDASMLAVKRARGAGALVVIDLDYRPYSWLSGPEAAEIYRAAIEISDVIVGNDEEFGVVAGGGLEDGRRYAATLGQGDKTVIYKMGERGSVTFRQGDAITTGVFPVAALKPMGAGDAFMASMMASLAAGHALPDAVLRGSAAAAMVVSAIGCAPAMPTTSELDAFIAENVAHHRVQA